jgi:hypothetical protein
MELLAALSRVFMPVFAFALIWPCSVVTLLVFVQYRRVARMEEKLFGRRINNVWTQAAVSLGLGIIGGFFASTLLLLMGLSLEQIGLAFIWPVAILLFLIHPRFLCFSYAGGIIASAVLLLRALLPHFPGLAGYRLTTSLLEIHIPAVLVLVALLHLIEALLIYIGGHWGSSPLYLKRPGGEVVGGFSLQRFWPLPLVALLVAVVLQAESAGVSMPEWWPVIKSTLQPGAGETLQYLAIPVAAGLGYADLALSSTPRRKSIASSRHLAVYSLVLFGLAVAAEYFPQFTLPGVLTAPLGHELLIFYSNRREFSREPLYRSAVQGVRLLMVIPGSAAARAGLREGDDILKVNGMPVLDQRDLLDKIAASYFMVLLEGTRGSGSFTAVLNKKHAVETVSPPRLPDSPSPARPPRPPLHRGADLGLIPVPSPASSIYVVTRRPAPLGWLRRLPGRK